MQVSIAFPSYFIEQENHFKIIGVFFIALLVIVPCYLLIFSFCN